jgi:ribonucleoside-diphosphate reductase alpha chain
MCIRDRGYLGLGSTLTMLKMRYGDDDSLKFTDEVSRILAEVGWETGIDLADEKGAAPIMEEEFVVTADMLAKRPEMAADGIKVGAKVKGKVLLGKYSRYMQQFPEGLRNKIAKKVYVLLTIVQLHQQVPFHYRLLIMQVMVLNLLSRIITVAM